MKLQWPILLDEFDAKSKELRRSNTQKRQGPSDAGALIVYSIVIFELPSATARQNDRLTLRKQFLAKVAFAV